MFLTADELEQLTGRVRPAAQARALMQMGIPFLRRPNGAPVVTRAAVEGLLPVRIDPAEPRLRLPA